MTLLALRNSFVIDDRYAVGGVWEGYPFDGGITQVYGQRSVTGSVHSGTDLGPYTGRGTPVRAPLPGYGRIYNYGDFGKQVIVQLEPDDVYGQLYMILPHLDSFELGMNRSVAEGEIVGYAGDSGLSFGVHTHFAFGIDPLISGDYRRCVDPYIFIKRAELEDDVAMAEYERGLLGVAFGDPTKMSGAYDVLNNYRSPEYPVGFFYAVNESDGSVDPIDGDDTDLNDSVVRMKRIGFLACDVVNGPKAWPIIK